MLSKVFSPDWLTVVTPKTILQRFKVLVEVVFVVAKVKLVEASRSSAKTEEKENAEPPVVVEAVVQVADPLVPAPLVVTAKGEDAEPDVLLHIAYTMTLLMIIAEEKVMVREPDAPSFPSLSPLLAE